MRAFMGGRVVRSGIQRTGKVRPAGNPIDFRRPNTGTGQHPDSQNDVTLLRVGPWVKGRLLGLDLGYYQGKLPTTIPKQHRLLPVSVEGPRQLRGAGVGQAAPTDHP